MTKLKCFYFIHSKTASDERKYATYSDLPQIYRYVVSVFSVFDRFLGKEQYTPLGSPHLAKNRLFAQFHANYPEKEKNDILDDLLKGPGNIRVLFVTIAFGIGVGLSQHQRSCAHRGSKYHGGIFPGKWEGWKG
ncbi:hypothetical protein OS493_026868 [Desmophyllum pertusum]|uniref:Uncharacterized protein n=1 Tax=Desmophyllum pertusum TaxID=174260 RepID=A0A9W9Z9V9_9CNID|nr:hypothetical protein OS493_026868 [Desmophyllum pertusum]